MYAWSCRGVETCTDKSGVTTDIHGVRGTSVERSRRDCSVPGWYVLSWQARPGPRVLITAVFGNGWEDAYNRIDQWGSRWRDKTTAAGIMVIAWGPVGAAIGVGTIHRIPIGPHLRPAGPRQFPGVLEGTETLTCPAHC